ncbi:hypothetical protein Pve01_10060 [Planomonospora venezuelensis]|nr:hypothetical protein Pve01_10060 [Planomonospora venezuelensis]
MALPDGLWMSSIARGLLDNLSGSGSRQAERCLSRRELEEWVDRLMRQRGEEGLSALRDAARDIAPSIRREPEMRVLDTLLSSVLATHDGGGLESVVLRARATGSPYDPSRMEKLEKLATALHDAPPDVLPSLPADSVRRRLLPLFLVTEVHPFDDGNGRVARIMMNAELVAGGEVRVIVPTVYRVNYLAALKSATHNDGFGALIGVLSFARRYTARIDFSDRSTAESDLTRTNAFRDALEAEANGIRLALP